jgi:hydroxyethylthiazole kinase-like uncharacterized protein yjeF
MVNYLKYLSVSQAQAFDRKAQKTLGIPSLILMENAGRSVAEEAVKMLRSKKRVAVICGVGNNGGDGMVAARHLLNARKKVDVYLVGKIFKLKPDPKINFGILKKMKIKIKLVKGIKDLAEIKSVDLIIDAIFGIGLRSEVRSPMIEVIKFINLCDRPVLSVDVPSGIDADCGRVLGAAIKANKTVTFVAPKRGFFQTGANKFCGKVIVRDIGIT